MLFGCSREAEISFCAYFVLAGNVKQASLQAGYSARNCAGRAGIGNFPEKGFITRVGDFPPR